MKSTTISIIVALALIIGAVILAKGDVGSDQAAAGGNNVTVVDGKQVIEIKAKGGYKPEKSVAKAGVPTVVRFDTNGTFDCTAVVRIPSMNISKNLPNSGITDIDIGSQSVSTLQGTCGMGMYPFEVEFKS